MTAAAPCVNPGGGGAATEASGVLVAAVSVPAGLERLDDYEPGGHHPVHLGDELGGQYRVVHKLASSSFANVWLCRDPPARRYIALKLVTADGSGPECPELRANRLAAAAGPEPPAAADGGLCAPLRHFRVKGPNGSHYAFVYPLLGPGVRSLAALRDTPELRGDLVSVCHHATLALAALHKRGICHGDVRPANMLTHVTGVDALSETELLAALGHPCTDETTVAAAVRRHPSPHVPRYLVYPVDWDASAAVALAGQRMPGANSSSRNGSGAGPSSASVITAGPRVALIDFAGSYCYREPVVAAAAAATDDSDLMVGACPPLSYCAPERAILQSPLGTATSAASMSSRGPACDVWALGCSIFEIRTGRRMFPSDLGVSTSGSSGNGNAGGSSDSDEVAEEEARRHPERVCGVLGHLLEHILDCRGSNGSSGGHVGVSGGGAAGATRPRQVDAHEAQLLADLLSQMLRLDPAERISAAQALEHPWFRLDGATAPVVGRL